MEVALSLLGGLVLGVVGSFVYGHLTRPRVELLGYRSITFSAGNNHGVLHKVIFKIRGRSPGASCLEIRYPSPRGRAYELQFAKWDEAANPVDQQGRFLHWMPPLGYHQPLLPGREYSVPVVFEDSDGFEIFSGFWFGKEQGYLKIRAVKAETPIILMLYGADLFHEWQVTPSVLAQATSQSTGDRAAL